MVSDVAPIDRRLGLIEVCSQTGQLSPGLYVGRWHGRRKLIERGHTQPFATLKSAPLAVELGKLAAVQAYADAMTTLICSGQRNRAATGSAVSSDRGIKGAAAWRSNTARTRDQGHQPRRVDNQAKRRLALALLYSSG